MPTRYAFKVHSLELARGLRGRKRLVQATSLNEDETKAFLKDKTGADFKPRDFLDDLVEAVTTLRDAEDSLTDIPRLIATDDGADEHVASSDPGTPRMVVTAVNVSGRRVSVTVEYGHLGYSHRAVGAKTKDEAQLSDKSPMEYYRTEFLVPDKGTHGIVATECIRSASSLPALTSWINHKLREKHGDEAMPRVMTPALADKQKIQSLLSSNAVAEIRLQRRGVARDGTRTGENLVLTQKVKSSGMIANAKALIDDWISHHDKKTRYDAAGRLAQVEALAEVVDDNAGDMNFTDGVVKLETSNGRMVSVTPDKIGEVFIYDISEIRPGTATWETRTRDQLSLMATAEKLSVAWA